MAPLKSVSGIVVSTFEWIIALLLGAVGLSALARRIKVPYPTFLAIGGALIAFVPSSPTWTLEPDLALALFVAPVLLDAAFDTSLRDLRNNWVPVSTLVVAAVGLTTVGVAYVAHRLMPDMPWAAAIALGAIVAPPDAAAAVAILSQVKLPYRMVKVLEGESLLNDATALLIYRIAVGISVIRSAKRMNSRARKWPARQLPTTTNRNIGAIDDAETLPAVAAMMARR